MPSLRTFAPLGKVTLLAGQNNVGKSNVIRFVERYLALAPERRNWEDEPRPDGETLQLATAHRLDVEAYEAWLTNPQARQRIDTFLSLDAFHLSGDESLHWIPRTQEVGHQYAGGAHPRWVLSSDWVDRLQEEAGGANLALTGLRNGLFSTSGGPAIDNVQAVVDKLFPFAPPPVEVIHAFRRVGEGEAADHSGSNLIATLADHQNPDVRERDKREKFDSINRFLQSVLEDPSVQIEVPANRQYIAVHHDGLVLPLEELGTGIHQAVILASAATLLDDTLVCIEEPEVNLHPVLQRKFIRHLTENTTNQYIVATHSAHMLDYERANVIHVRKTEGGTIGSPATTTQHVADVCADLGYRPSDILQANAVIWVEGPSDRIYINHWLRLLEPEHPFIEGIHYAVMFYGGSTRSHLTGLDPMPDETASDLISLRRINRHSMIVIDSDKTRAHGDNLDDNKVRVRDEFDREDLPGHAWVTDRRTIENYVPSDILTAAVAAAHPHARYQPPQTKWDDPLFAYRAKGTQRAALAKTKVANEVVARWIPDRKLEPALASQMRKVYAFIKNANAHD